MVSVETVSIVIAAVSVVIGVINSIMSNRKAEQQRQMQIFTQLYDYFVDKEFSRDYKEWLDMFEWTNVDDYWQKYRIANKTNLDDAAQHERLRRVLAYFSVALNRGLLDIELVDDLVAGPIIQWWEKMKPMYLEMRKQHPLVGDDMEAAYNLLIKRRQQELELTQSR